MAGLRLNCWQSSPRKATESCLDLNQGRMARLNDQECKEVPRKSCILSSVRRLHEEDQAGDIAENELGVGAFLLPPRVPMLKGMPHISDLGSCINCLADFGSNFHCMFSLLRQLNQLKQARRAIERAKWRKRISGVAGTATAQVE